MSESLVNQREPDSGPAALSVSTEKFAASLARQTEQRQLLAQYIKTNMVEGVDYGVIPGTDKKVMLKPGAEKITSLFECTARFTLIDKVENWDRPLFAYTFKCEVIQRASGHLLAEGVGSANSMEGNYRWRPAQRLCPRCGKDTIIKGKEEYGGGWLCFAKKGGCGAKFQERAPEIISQAVGRVENDDIFTLVNTILKMAKKRSVVDASLALGLCSDLFTQDIEDLAEAGADLSKRANSGKVIVDESTGEIISDARDQPAPPVNKPSFTEKLKAREKVSPAPPAVQMATALKARQEGWDSDGQVKHPLDDDEPAPALRVVGDSDAKQFETELMVAKQWIRQVYDDNGRDGVKLFALIKECFGRTVAKMADVEPALKELSLGQLVDGVEALKQKRSEKR